jgi:hypothetical protein
MPQIINWDLIREPINWVIVALMLAIAVFGLNLIVNSGSGSNPLGLPGLSS